MQKIIIRNLETQDFKGIGTQSLNFNDGRIKLSGLNGAGKTSIVEAIIFSFIGVGLSNDKVANEPIAKDGNVKKDYIQNIKLTFEIVGSVNPDHNGIHTIEKEIIKNKLTTMLFDGSIYTLGKEFKSHILEVLGLTQQELLIMTNPKFLNVVLKNKDAREYIVSLVNRKSDTEAVDEYISTIGSEFNFDFINHVKTNIAKGINIFDSIELKSQELKTSTRKIEDLDTKISSKQESLDKITEHSDADKDVTALILERDSLQARINSNHEHNQKIFTKQKNLSKLEGHIASKKMELERKQQEISNIKNLNLQRNANIAKFEEKYKILNMQPIKEECLVCGSVTESTKQQGQEYKNRELNTLTDQITNSQSSMYTGIAKIKILENEIVEITKDINVTSFELGQASYTDEIYNVSELQNRLNSLNSSIGNNDSIKSIKDEIIELDDNRIKANSVNDTLQFELKTLQNIFAYQAKQIQGEINTNLNGYTLKLFDIMKNGNIKDIYSLEKDGVDYAKMNNASQINAGLSMINYIQDLKGIQAFRIVDNAESVNKLIPTESQSFELYVTDKPLEVK